MSIARFACVPLASLVLVSACTSPEPSTTGPAAAPRPVATAAVVAETVPERFEAGGLVQAAATVEIVSRIMAPVADVRVTAGSRVAAGAALVVLDARQLDAEHLRAQASHRAAGQGVDAAKANLERAQAQYTLASKTHDRLAGLRARNSSTQHELDLARAELDVAAAEVQAARSGAAQMAAGLEAAAASESVTDVTRSYSVLRAPFAGLITGTHVDAGAMALPGVRLVTIEGLGRYRLLARLDEARVGSVAVGQRVQVTLGGGNDGSGVTVDGQVTEIARVIDSAHTFGVEIALPQDQVVRSGTFGTAGFEGASRTVILVPDTSVVRRGQLSSVFVLSDGRARMRLVRLGPLRGGRVEVMAGLDSGETLVLDPAGLTDGSPVEAQAPVGPVQGVRP